MPADNTRYPLGLDFYEGNSVRDWSALVDWAAGVRFAYFRAGIGLHKDNLTLFGQAAQNTTWPLGLYYELWTPDVPKADQAKTLLDQMNLVGVGDRLALPTAIAFEPQTRFDNHGRRITEFPSVGDLNYFMEAPAIAGPSGVCCYTNEAGLIEIRRVLGKIPEAWRFWLARYSVNATEEIDAEASLAMYESRYGVDRARILFMQTSEAGPYPAGASWDKGADYDRAIAFTFDAPAPVGDREYVVNVPEAATLSLRAAPTEAAPWLGGLAKGSRLVGRVGPDGWFPVPAGFVKGEYLQVIGGQEPPPVEPPPTPEPPPVVPPTPAGPGLGLYYLLTRLEFRAAGGQGAGADGTFSQIGGRGQDNFVGLDQAARDWVFSIGPNSHLVNWASGPGRIYRTDYGPNAGALPWPVILAASITGEPRMMVNVIDRFTEAGEKWIVIEGIRKAADYSKVTPDRFPWLFGTLGTIYKDGHDGPGVHPVPGLGNLPFIMPYFDPRDFPGPAGRKLNVNGITVSEKVLWRPVPSGS